MGFLEDPFKEGRFEFFPDAEEESEDGKSVVGGEKKEDSDAWGDWPAVEGQGGSTGSGPKEAGEEKPKGDRGSETKGKGGEEPRKRKGAARKGKGSAEGKRIKRRSRSPSMLPADEEFDNKKGEGRGQAKKQGAGFHAEKINELRSKLQVARKEYRATKGEIRKLEQGETKSGGEDSSEEESVPSAGGVQEEGAASSDKKEGGEGKEKGPEKKED